VIAGGRQKEIIDFGIRYYGVPAGQRIRSVDHDLVTVSKRKSGLNEETRAFTGRSEGHGSFAWFVFDSYLTILPASRGACSSHGPGEPFREAEAIEATEFRDVVGRLSLRSSADHHQSRSGGCVSRCS